MNSEHPQIVYVLGGPGSGKGTQCERLVRDFHFHHISVGDIMRAEIASKTEDGLFIKKLVDKGEMVPTEITVKLLLKTIKASKSQKFLIDGFPRGLEQAIKLENLFQEIEFILNFDCPEEILVERLVSRGKTSGRSDDNEETIRNRIKVFNGSTKPALDFYWRFGKVRTVSATGSIEEVYSQVLDKLKKNIIFLYGPPCINKTGLAQLISTVTGYRHIELRSFWGNKNWSEEEKVNRLMSFLSAIPEENVVIDGFFESLKQTKIFLENFQKPRNVFWFDALKDYVDEQLLKAKSKEKEKAYKEYMKNRKEIVDFFKKEPQNKKFPVNADVPVESYFKKILNEFLAPEVYMAIPDENPALFKSYMAALEAERHFVHLNLPQMLKQESERNTSLGQEISKYHLSEVPLEVQVALLRKILFKQARGLKFMITGYPSEFEAYRFFEENCREISFVVTFQSESQKLSFSCGSDPLFTPQTYYHTIGKHMVIDRDSLALFDYYTQRRNNYYLCLAPPFFERTAISKHLAEKFGLQLVEWEETNTKLKEKLGGDEGPIEELSFQQILKHFTDVFAAAQTKGTSLILDGFPYTVAEVELWINALGAPKGTLSLEMSKEGLVRAYRANKGLEADAEIPEEEMEEMNKGKDKHEGFCQVVEKLSQENFGSNFYRINANISMSTIKTTVEALFFKRVYLVTHSFPIYGEGDLDDKFLQIFANIAARNQILFIDVRALIKEEMKRAGPLTDKLNSQYLMRWTDKPEDFPSNYTPELIMELIKKFIAGLTVQSREIMIFNYPMGDNAHDRNNDELVFPRALDELAMIESALGQIRMVYSINEGLAPSKEYQDPLIEWPVEEAPQKVEEKKDPDNPDDPPADKKDDPDNPDEEKKFNPKEFQWTESNGFPKALSQIYNKMKPAIWQTVDLERSGNNYVELEEIFEKDQASINEGNEDNFFIEIACSHFAGDQTQN